MIRRRDISDLIRPDLKDFVPYQSKGGVGRRGIAFLNANESPRSPLRGGSLNRYPDPGQVRLKKKLANIYGIYQNRLFLGNGSDEVIDLIIRGFCIPGSDRIMILPPTYGMYSTAAALNGVDVIRVPLDKNFQPDREGILSKTEKVKILFLCSPNNPTGNLFDREIMEGIFSVFPGLIVVDEAYIDFSGDPGWVGASDKYPNLVVIRTLSKSRGLAGARVGVLIADPDIADFLNSIKPPYNISRLSIDAALSVLSRERFYRNNLKQIVSQREELLSGLYRTGRVKSVYPTDSNFILVKFENEGRVFRYLYENGVIVRNVSTFPGCANCLRITVGSKSENKLLLKLLANYEEEMENGKSIVY